MKIKSGDNIIECIKEASEDEIDFILLENRSIFSIGGCGVSVQLNKEELYRFIEELDGIADSMEE